MVAQKGLVFYNSDNVAGASQPHKHIQVVKLDQLLDSPFIDLFDEHSSKNEPLPFYNFIHGIKKIQVPDLDDQFDLQSETK